MSLRNAVSPGRLGLALILVSALSGMTGCAQAADGWQIHQDPNGFSVELPSQWKATASIAKGMIEIQGTEGVQIAIWPVFVAGDLNDVNARSVLGGVISKWRPIQWGPVETAGPGRLRVRGSPTGKPAVAFLVWEVRSEGSVGAVYSVASERSSLESLSETLARILRSFHLVPGAERARPGPQPEPRYVQWQDPREGAFRLKAPAQWQMSGGTHRMAAVDVRAAWQAASPDGEIRIWGGDADIPVFIVPSQMLQMAGFPEGSWYSPGYGVQNMVRRFVTGSAFAREHVERKFSRECASISFTEVQDRPDAARAINQIYAQFGQVGLSVQLSAGDVSFTCQKQGRPQAGYYFAATQLVQSPGGALWNVEKLFGYLAPSGKEGQVRNIFPEIVHSFQLNPEWAAMQQGLVGNVTSIVTQTQAEISRIIAKTFENQQRSREPGLEAFSRATLGVEDLVNPATGERMRVESGFNHYWENDRGQVVGTQTDTYPGGNQNWRQLIIEGAR